MKKQGFTLIELIATIIILAVIALIITPLIVGVIKDVKKNAMKTDAEMVIKALKYKVYEDEAFDVTTVNQTNMVSLLGRSNKNYSSITVTKIDKEINVFIVGKGKWKDLYAYGTAKKMTIMDEEAANNTKLDGLLILNGVSEQIALQPAFNKDTTAYTTLNVGYSVSAITITPTAESPLSTIKIYGMAVANGQPSSPLSLNIGSNTISIIVTSPSGTSTTYTVVIIRNMSTDLTSVNFNFTGSRYSSSSTVVVNSSSLNYTVNVSAVAASVVVIPYTVASSGVSVRVNGTLITGQSLPITLTAPQTIISILVSDDWGGGSPTEYIFTINEV